MRDALKLVIIVFPFWIAIRSVVFFRNKNSLVFSWSRELLYCLSFMYFITLLSITLLNFKLGTGFADPRISPSEYLMRTVNFVPFKYTIIMFRIAIAKNNIFFIRWAILNVIGNGILLLPLGFLLPMLKPKYCSLKKIFLTGLSVSCFIELMQFIGTFLNIFFRTVDIDDIILNTLSCILGYIIYKIFKKVMAYFHNNFPKTKKQKAPQ